MKRMSKKSLIGIIIGAVMTILGVVVAIVTGNIRKKKGLAPLKDHPTKYKPL